MNRLQIQKKFVRRTADRPRKAIQRRNCVDQENKMIFERGIMFLKSHPMICSYCTVFAYLSVVCVSGCSEEPVESESSNSCNVLLVTLDTTRADHLGCYGYQKTTSPHFDALAEQGTRFDLAIAQSAVTPVSHASILTGLNPYQHGVRVIYAARAFQLSDTVPTLATVLRQRGWDTGAFVSSFAASEYYGLDQGFDHFDNGMEGNVKKQMTLQEDGHWGWGLPRNQRRSDDTTDAAIDWMKNARHPFFLWVHYWDPHDAEIIPPPAIVSRFSTASSSRVRKAVELYDSEIYFVDSQFGRLMNQLRDLDQYENTIVVVVSDHGQGLGNHNWWHHRILYQEQIRVPLIVRIPEVASTRNIKDLVRTIDIFPTIIEALGISQDNMVQGRSLMGLIQGEKEAGRIAYADQLNLYDLNAMILEKRPNDDLLYCAMDRSWKFVCRPRQPNLNELFHLETDPHEKVNLYAKNHPEALRLLGALQAFNGWVNEPFGEGGDATALERLRSLGYVGDDTEGKQGDH